MCLLVEQRHPEFPCAVAAEERAVRNGDLNFAGTGLPPELRHHEGGDAEDLR